MAAPSVPFDSPLLNSIRGRPDGRSPGLATLKEAFDITYAVHRMEEEGARRRAYNGPGGAGTRGFLHELNEDDEDGEEELELAQVDEAKRTNAVLGTGAVGNRGRDGRDQAYEGRAGTRDQGQQQYTRNRAAKKTISNGHRTQGFELDMASATLLGRRHRRTGEPSPLGLQSVTPLSLPPGSPMRDVHAA